MAFKNVVVVSDEAHHRYRERPEGDDERPVAAEEKEEAKRNAEAARLAAPILRLMRVRRQWEVCSMSGCWLAELKTKFL